MGSSWCHHLTDPSLPPSRARGQTTRCSIRIITRSLRYFVHVTAQKWTAERKHIYGVNFIGLPFPRYGIFNISLFLMLVVNRTFARHTRTWAFFFSVNISLALSPNPTIAFCVPFLSSSNECRLGMGWGASSCRTLSIPVSWSLGHEARHWTFGLGWDPSPLHLNIFQNKIKDKSNEQNTNFR